MSVEADIAATHAKLPVGEIVSTTVRIWPSGELVKRTFVVSEHLEDGIRLEPVDGRREVPA